MPPATRPIPHLLCLTSRAQQQRIGWCSRPATTQMGEEQGQVSQDGVRAGGPEGSACTASREHRKALLPTAKEAAPEEDGKAAGPGIACARQRG